MMDITIFTHGGVKIVQGAGKGQAGGVIRS